MQPNVWYTKEEIEKMNLKLSDSKILVISHEPDSNNTFDPYYHIEHLGNAFNSIFITHVMLITPPPAVKKKRKE